MENGRMSPSVAQTLHELEINKWPVVVIDTSPAEFDWPEWATVIRRPNTSQDWGSWATALNMMPGLWEAKTLLQMNDSLVGPLYPMGSLLRLMDADDADYIGLVDNPEISYHFSAMFVSYCNNSINKEPFKTFWKEISTVANKVDHIREHEIHLSTIAIQANLRIRALFTCEDVDVDYSPLYRAAKKLLDAGCPLLKRRLVHFNPRATQDYVIKYGQNAVVMVDYALSEKLT
jgi:lipopolysaccharide biosynthesis protein